MRSKGHCPIWDCLVNFGKNYAEIGRFGMAILEKGFFGFLWNCIVLKKPYRLLDSPDNCLQ